MSDTFYHSKILPHIGIIMKLCRAYANSPEDLQDYYQEVCLQIWKSRKNFKEESSWTTWIYRITLNVCLTQVRKNKKQKDVLNKMTPVDESSPGVYEDAGEIELLYAAIKKLSDVDRAIIMLYLEERTYQEIGDIIGARANSVGVRITRIKKRLKKLFNGKID